MDNLSLKKVLAALKEWSLEANNPRNDGWVQKGYEEKIKKVFHEAGELLKKNK
jgi:hypothetical protein